MFAKKIINGEEVIYTPGKVEYEAKKALKHYIGNGTLVTISGVNPQGAHYKTDGYIESIENRTGMYRSEELVIKVFLGQILESKFNQSNGKIHKWIHDTFTLYDTDFHPSIYSFIVDKIVETNNPKNIIYKNPLFKEMSEYAHHFAEPDRCELCRVPGNSAQNKLLKDIAKPVIYNGQQEIIRAVGRDYGKDLVYAALCNSFKPINPKDIKPDLEAYQHLHNSKTITDNEDEKEL